MMLVRAEGGPSHGQIFSMDDQGKGLSGLPKLWIVVVSDPIKWDNFSDPYSLVPFKTTVYQLRFLQGEPVYVHESIKDMKYSTKPKVADPKYDKGGTPFVGQWVPLGAVMDEPFWSDVWSSAPPPVSPPVPPKLPAWLDDFEQSLDLE